MLYTDAGQFAENVQLIGQVLELDQVHQPRTVLLSHNGLERDSSVAMAAASIMKENVNFFHSRDCAIRLMFAAKSKLHAMWITKEVQCVQAVP